MHVHASHRKDSPNITPIVVALCVKTSRLSRTSTQVFMVVHSELKSTVINNNVAYTQIIYT